MLPSSHFLLPTIEECFKRLSINSSDLKAVAASVGPGLYTGIRVGAAAAKGLAFARSLPLIGFCSLESYISTVGGPFASILEARLGGSFVWLRERRKEAMVELSPPQFVAAEELEKMLSGFERRVGPHLSDPDLTFLAQHIENTFQRGGYGSDLELIYLRTPSYQTHWGS